MKKLLPVIPTAVIIGISALFLIYMCLPPNPETAYEIYTFDAHFLRTRGLYLMGSGGILFVALNQLALFFFRRQDKRYLLFTLLCIVCFAHTFFTQNGLNETFGWIEPGELLTKIKDFFVFLAHYTICFVGLYTLRRDFVFKHKMQLILYLFAGVISCVFLPVYRYELIFRSVILIVGITAVILMVQSSQLKESKWVRLYYLSYVSYLFLGIFWAFIDPGTFLIPGFTCLLFMIFSYVLLISKNYTDAFTFVEETNQNLEQLVDERTRNLQAANEAMQTTNNAMKELVQSISHDLKTPLAIMSVNLESLSSLAATQSDTDYQRHVRIAYQKNLDLQRLILNLFEVSRIETDRNTYTPQWESLILLLAKLKEKYDDYMEDRGLSFDIDPSDNLEIFTDPLKIWSVLDNVLYNSVRHTDSGGITISTHSEGSNATVTITDTGRGISPEHLPHVFERFYKGSQARSTNEGESGLGLYIVKSVMEGCGGSVDIKSEQGKGTSVILTFPARTAKKQAENN
jgi:signal transduction histidine kinase